MVWWCIRIFQGFRGKTGKLRLYTGCFGVYLRGRWDYSQLISISLTFRGEKRERRPRSPNRVKLNRINLTITATALSISSVSWRLKTKTHIVFVKMKDHDKIENLRHRSEYIESHHLQFSALCPWALAWGVTSLSWLLLLERISSTASLDRLWRVGTLPACLVRI